jgi:heme-degrading monooxygenase HmoA
MLVVSNRLPVVAGREAEFEALFEERSGMAAERDGLRRLELLQPVEAETYVIQAYWESWDAFERWRASADFETAHADLPDDLFSGPNQLEIHELAVTYDE